MLSRCFSQAVSRFRSDNIEAKALPPLQDPGLVLFMLWASGALLAATLACFLWAGGYHAFFATTNGWATGMPDWFPQMLSALGDTSVAVCWVFLLARGDQRLFWLMVVAAILCASLVHGFKYAFDSLRPAGALAENTFHQLGIVVRWNGFPSGHTATAFCCAGILAVKYQSLWARSLLFLIAVFIGLGRVWVGAHWPLDVMAGAAVGMLGLVLSLRICRLVPQGLNLSLQVFFFCVFLANSLYVFVHDTGYPAVTVVGILSGVASLGYYLYGYYSHFKVNQSSYPP